MPRVTRQSPRTRRERRMCQRLIPPTIDELSYNFDSIMRDITVDSCVSCDRTYPDLKLDKNFDCHSCKIDRTLFSSQNDMDIGEVPEELQSLTMIEEILIARIHPLMSLYRIRGNQLAYSGNVISFRKDVSSIARILPHNLNDLDALLLVNKETPSGLQIFRVRAVKILRALQWLKIHHRYYSDIEIADSRIHALPEDGDIVPLLMDLGFEDAADVVMDAEEEALGLERSFCPSIPIINQQAAIQRTARTENIEIDFPMMESEPVNEFTTEGYISMAFPTLLPTGRGDLRYPLREKRIDFDAYFKYLLQYRDQRFMKHPRFPFFAMNSKARWDALRLGSVYIRRNPRFDSMTIDEFLIHLESHPNFADSIMYFTSHLRATRAYWRQRCSELLDMVAQLGSPTIFFTLSAADYHWPDLFKLLSPRNDPTNLSSRQRRDLMHQNPHYTAFFFKKRAEYFITHTIVKLFNVKDYWFRYEWQWRGSPHVHGLLWCADAPNIDNIESFTDEEIQNTVRYFDAICSAMNSNFQARSEVNPCRKRYSDIPFHEKDDDLDELLNNVQRHTRHSKSCMRKKRGSRQEVCRFGFPKPVQEVSSIVRGEYDDGVFQFLPKRNDSFMQRYNPLVSQMWRGNTDFSPIVSREAVLNYIAKYASKSEKSSESYQSIAMKIVESRQDDTTPKSIIKRIILKSVSERDYSAQEVAHLLMSWPLFRSSRSIITLIINENWRSGNSPSESSPIESYKTRSSDFESYSLFDFVQQCRVARGRTIKRKQNCIVRIVPKVKYRDGEDNEEYFRYLCKLYLPWREDVVSLKARDQTWQEVYSTNNIAAELNDLDFPNYEPIYEDDEEVDLEDIIERDVEMAAAQIGPNEENVDAVGRRGVDQAFTWTDITTSAYDQQQILNFHVRLKNHFNSNPLEFNRSAAQSFQFSEAQETALQLCRDQISNPNCTFKRVLIQGKAGTGKSALIREICHLVSNHNGSSRGYQVLAPTGAAAINVDGKTLHNFLRIPIGEFIELTGGSLREVQNRFETIQFLLFDEYSMIGARMLQKINQRCMQAKKSNEPFGGLFVWFFGDLRQLPPVRDCPVYSECRDQYSALGKLAFNSIQRHIVLSTSFRQRSDQGFRDILDEISRGTITNDSFNKLMSRRQCIIREEQSQFSSAIRLFPTNQAVNRYNFDVLENSRNPVAEIRAEHNNRTAEAGTDDQTQSLATTLYLSIGCRVILRKNLKVEAGLVNGALGTVVDIIYREGRRPPSLPLAIMVRFDNYTCPVSLEGLVPILPVSVHWKKGSLDCSRRQFPLTLAYALTIHKSQGLTLDRAVIDIGDKEASPGLSYVALSRVKTLDSLILLNGYNEERFNSIAGMRLVYQRESYMREKFGSI